MAYMLKINCNTWLKLSTAESTTLPDNQKQAISAGTELPISSYEIVGDHIKVSLGDDTQGKQLEYQGHNTWYVFRTDIEVLQDGKPLNLLPTSVNLPIPHYDYYDQNDNKEAPWWSFNVTAIAMNLHTSTFLNAIPQCAIPMNSMRTVMSMDSIAILHLIS